MSISVQLQGDGTCSIQNEDTQWFSEVDKQAGGTGKYPSPHELLDSALGACTALTLQLYAARKKYSLSGVHVEIQRDEAQGVYRMQRRITLTGNLDTATREELLHIANKCPIHKALSGQFQIESQLV